MISDKMIIDQTHPRVTIIGQYPYPFQKSNSKEYRGMDTLGILAAAVYFTDLFYLAKNLKLITSQTSGD